MSVSNPVLDCIHSRRSIRRYTPAPVSREMVTAILEAARWAPTGKNKQANRFLVLQQSDPRKNAVADFSGHRRMLVECAVSIVVVLDKTSCYYREKDCQSAGSALQSMLLAAHSMGLGAVWIGELLAKGPQVLQALGLDTERYELMAVVAVGHPAEEGSATRHSMEELLLEPF